MLYFYYIINKVEKGEITMTRLEKKNKNNGFNDLDNLLSRNINKLPRLIVRKNYSCNSKTVRCNKFLTNDVQ